MVTAGQVVALVDAVVAADHPDAVVLFGSHADGRLGRGPALDGLAVSIRYPGVKATRDGTAQAVRTCRQRRARVRRSRGL